MNIISQLEAEQVKSLAKDIPDFQAGDTVRVGYKVTEGTRTRVQNYEGVCIARKGGNGIAGSFTVRKISFGEGVERVFPLHSTNIDSIKVVRTGKVRRAKLYYLRALRGKAARIAERAPGRSAKAEGGPSKKVAKAAGKEQKPAQAAKDSAVKAEKAAKQKPEAKAAAAPPQKADGKASESKGEKK